jgi:hypothetical protein
MRPGNCHGNYRELVLKLPIAQRIVAESPQDLQEQIRGLAAESLVFGAERQKCAKSIYKNRGIQSI